MDDVDVKERHDNTSIVFSANVGSLAPGQHLGGNIHIKSTDATNSIVIPVDFYVVAPTVISAPATSPR